MKYTLGLDVGTNSIGWAILKLDQSGAPQSIENLGSRIFSDGRNPKDKTTLASSRRQKRHERRRRDRFAQRKKLVLNQLIKMNLFPSAEMEQQDLKALDVLTLRAKAASAKISSFELGRVFYYLNLRRGFKSNRKGGSAEDKANKISERIANLKKQLVENNFLSVGQYLQSRYTKGLSTKATIANDFHLLRSLIEEEFDLICTTQKPHHPSLTEEHWQTLKNRIFYQRPLRDVETGPCSIFPEDVRTYKYMPSFEDYRFLTELFNLSYQDADFKSHSLTCQQVFKVFYELRNTKETSYTKIKKLLKIPEITFSIEVSKSKDKIKISVANHFFSNDLVFGKKWDSFKPELRDQIATIFLSENPLSMIRSQLAKLNIESEIIENMLKMDIPGINEVTCSYSAAALRKIILLCLNEGRHPSLIVDDLIRNEKADQKLADQLGYYGASIPEFLQPIPKHIQESNHSLNIDEKRYGKIANPTVHAALNQIRQVVNELISFYGKPENIHIEFARDLKKSKDEKEQDRKKQKQNEERNTEVKKFIEKYKQKPTAFNFERVKLWFELDAMKNQMCAYSGKPISQRMVLSDEVQVDHILPFSRTLDDSLGNKVLVLASENVKKGHKTPHEAFHKDENKWAAIQERAKKLPYHKQWRFAAEAILKFEEKDNFLQRHLNDTRYISKISKKYLQSITDQHKIVASKGQITSLIRGKLGLNQFIQRQDGTKDRDDHRHHAIDALAVALTSRSFLKSISDASSKKKDPNKIPIPQPWEGFIEDVREKFDKIVVSHKVDHGKNGPFMEETCFGIIKDLSPYEEENDLKLVTTKPRSTLTDKHINTIKNKHLRQIAQKKGIDGLPQEIKKLRVYDVTKEEIKKIGKPDSGLAKIVHGKSGTHTKYYKKGDINYLAIWCLPKEIPLKQENYEKRKSDYIFSAVKTFDLNSTKDQNSLKPHPAAKLVVKIYKNDTIALEINSVKKIFILKSIKAANRQLYFLPVNKSTESEGEKQFLLAFSKLAEFKFRKIHISATGALQDAGPILK